MKFPLPFGGGLPRRGPWLAATLVVSLFSAQVGAQAQQAPTAAETASPGGGADARQLYLVAHDKKGDPVLDLKPGDLTITEDGSPLKLDDLQLVDTRRNKASDLKDADDKQIRPVVSFVFDPILTDKEEHAQKSSSKILTARAAAMKILTLLAESGFEFSVFNIDSRLHLQQKFTPEISEVKSAIEAATGSGASKDKGHSAASEKEIIAVALSGADAAGKRASTRERLLDQSIYAALRNSTRIAQDRHISPSFSSLLALAQAQQGVAGKKTIIYLSSLREDQIKDAAKQAVESIIGAANQGGVSIDIVDGSSLGEHGAKVHLMADAGSGSVAAGLSMRNYGQGETTLDIQEDAQVDVDLKHLAEATGGTYFNGDGQKEMRQLVGDIATFYEASFVPISAEYDGKLHPLAVKPLRAGLKVRTQTGYLALPPPSADGSSLQPFELPLLKRLQESPLPAQFPFRASVLDMGDSEDGRRNTLAIEVPVEGLELDKDANSPASLAHLAMIAEVKDASGATAAHFSSDTPQRVVVRENEAQKAAGKAAEVVSLQRHFVLPAGKYTLELLMVETTTGKAAARRIPFEVSGKSSAPSLSNVVLVRRTDPVPATDADTTDPLRDGKSRVTPNISGTMPTGDSNVSIYFAVHDNPASAQPAKLEIKVLRDGQELGGAPLLAKQVRGGEFYSYLGSFSLSPATDGKYVVEALLTQDGKTVESDTAFTLSGMEGAEEESAGAGSDAPALESISRPAGPLKIAVSANPISKPSDSEIKDLLAEAGQYVNAYWDSLPNFMCQQVTERFVGSHHDQKWEHVDTVTGKLTYYDHQEDWQFEEYEKDRKKSHDSTPDSVRGVSSAGVFGGLSRGVFRPGAKAEITWYETDALEGGTVQVFKYRVAIENSNLYLRAGPREVVHVGYHGMVYIDSASHVVRRITQVADAVPNSSPIRESLISADYDYASISGQQYLLPIGAQVAVRRGSHKAKLELNQIRFRDFHRFRSTATIMTSMPDAKP